MVAEPNRRDAAGARVEVVVVVGAPAGGVEALAQLVSSLPPDLGAPVVIVLHVSPDAPSLLPRIIARESLLPVRPATDAEPRCGDRPAVSAPPRGTGPVPWRSC